MFARFSVSSNLRPDADYSAARVSVTVNGAPVATRVLPLAPGAGDNTIVAEVSIPEAMRTGDATIATTVDGAVDRTSGQPFSLQIVSNAFVFEPPTAPRITSARRDGVMWTAATERGAAVTGYTIEYRPAGASSDSIPEYVQHTAATTLRTAPPALRRGVVYRVTVRAESRMGEAASDASPSLVVLDAPRSVTAQLRAKRRTATVRWSRVAGATLYDVRLASRGRTVARRLMIRTASSTSIVLPRASSRWPTRVTVAAMSNGVVGPPTTVRVRVMR